MSLIMGREHAKIETRHCVECRGEVPAGRPIHCTRRDPLALKKISVPHHGRFRWRCPACGRALGCDACVGQPGEAFCRHCRVYADGGEAVETTAEERRVMIGLIPHAAPQRAVTITRLASDLAMDDADLRMLLADLQQKGLVLVFGDRCCLQPAEMARRVPLFASGIELSLPLADRMDA
jgi:hypothetical protein